MTALRLGIRIDQTAWKSPIPQTPQPGSSEPRATAHPCVRTPARRNAKPRLSDEPTEIHRGVYSSDAVVYHRAGTHLERRSKREERHRSNTNQREALGLVGLRSRSERISALQSLYMAKSAEVAGGRHPLREV